MPDDSSEQIRTAPLVEFAVELESIPTSGYVWQSPPCPEGLEALGSSLVQPAAPPVPGSSARQVFRFRAHRAGQFALDFVLKRSWESASLQRHTVNIEVV